MTVDEQIKIASTYTVAYERRMDRSRLLLELQRSAKTLNVLDRLAAEWETFLKNPTLFLTKRQIGALKRMAATVLADPDFYAKPDYTKDLSKFIDKNYR